MKTKLLQLLFLFTILSNAQIVNIPNAAFKSRLLSANSTNSIAKDVNGNYIDIDANNDNEIQESEALQVKELKLIESITVSSIEGINSFLNLTYFEYKFNGLVNADLTALNQLNYLDIYCGTLNLGTKNNLDTLYAIHTTSITYTSATATLKKIKSSLNLFLSINYLLKINLEEIKIQNLTMQMTDFEYSNLKYMYNLRVLDLGLTDGSDLAFTNYNPLDSPLYPQNLKTLIVRHLHPSLNYMNLNPIENLEFYSIDAAVFETYQYPYPDAVQTFNPVNFPNLKSLRLIRYYNGIQNLNLSPLTHLETFITNEDTTSSSYNSSFTINFGNNSNLKKVILNDLPTPILNFSGNPNLEELEIYTNNSSLVQSSTNVNITFATINNIKKIKANIPFRNASTSWNNQPRNIEFTNLNNNNSLERLDLSFCSPIQPLVLNNNSLNYFYAFRCVFNNNLTFGNLPSLSYLNIETLNGELSVTNLITNDLMLDLSGCTILTSLDVHYPKLRFISLKNGITQNVPEVDLSNDNQGLTICIDSFEQPTIINGSPFGWDVPTNHNFTNYCTLTPNGTFNTLTGKALFDNDSNGCSVTDTNASNVLIKSTIGTTNTITLSNSAGNYTQYLGLGNYTNSVILENPTYFTAAPSTFTSDFTTYNNIQNQDICLVSNGNFNDLDITIIPLNSARPGFNSKYKLLLRNKGTTTLSGNFSLNYNNNKVSYVSSSINPANTTSTTLSWNFNNLTTFNDFEIVVEFNVNAPTDPNPVNGGDVLTYSSSIGNTFTEQTATDNSFTLNQVVVNAYDPNDKTCLEGTIVTPDKIGKYVNYIIRFENTGSANATNVIIKDIINLGRFDINSIIPLDSSHPYRMTITGSNRVEFFFENINLPFSPSDSRYGYIAFKIKLKSNLVVGNTFSNVANIYFDYNAPIVTNSYTTTIQNTLGLQENELLNTISVYPNPVKDMLHFQTKENVLKIEIYDVAGRIVSSKSIIENKLNLSELKVGNYFLKVYTEKGIMHTKIIKE